MDGFSLRERKHARTKLAIMRAFIERLKNSRFDDISIKKVCADAEVAEGTFFNYFPEKIVVVNYYLHLSLLKMVWTARSATPAGKSIPFINALAAEIMTWDTGNLIYQIMSLLLVQREEPRAMPISAFEKALAFPECPGIEEIPVKWLEDWFREYVVKAKDDGELPLKTGVEDAVVSIMTVISGTLLAVEPDKSESRKYHCMRQLKALWRDFGVKERKG